MKKKRTQIAHAPRSRTQIPLFCIGNLVVGGSGKSPVVASLVALLQDHGYRPGIVSRGYGGIARALPIEVHLDSRAEQVGDEPLMLKKRLGCPVVVCQDRARAVEFLHHHHSVDVVLSDDGLQHVRLWRDFSICVFSADQGIGNGLPLPFGPLREPLSVLDQMDAIVVRGTDDATSSLSAMGIVTDTPSFASQSRILEAYRSDQPQLRVPLSELAGQGDWHAVAGIAKPERFFEALQAVGFSITPHAFTDHHAFSPEEIEEWPWLIATEKDAVKLVHCRKTPFWVVVLECQHGAFDAWVLDKLSRWSRV